MKYTSFIELNDEPDLRGIKKLAPIIANAIRSIPIVNFKYEFIFFFEIAGLFGLWGVEDTSVLIKTGICS